MQQEFTATVRVTITNGTHRPVTRDVVREFLEVDTPEFGAVQFSVSVDGISEISRVDEKSAA